MLSTPDLYTLVSAAAEGEKELTAFDGKKCLWSCGKGF
jgi:hypothetical protein